MMGVILARTPVDDIVVRFAVLPGGLNGRVRIWRDAIRIVPDFPVAGIGLPDNPGVRITGELETSE